MGMYDEVYHQGKSLKEWSKELNGEFTCGELYRMAKDGEDLQKFMLERKGHVSA